MIGYEHVENGFMETFEEVNFIESLLSLEIVWIICFLVQELIN